MFHRTISAVFASLLVIGVAWGGADQPGPLPDVPAIVMPEPPASGQITITSEVFYVIASDSPLIILTSPDNAVKLVEDTGPVTYKGRFVDNPSVVAKKTFTQKHVYQLEPITNVKAEVLVIPQGVTDAKLIKRQSVLVNDGTGPAPPPDADAAFKAKLEAAWKAETNVSKFALAKQLAAVFGEAGVNTVKDARLNTIEDLYSAIQAAGHSVVPLPKLEGVRRVIADELRTKLPVPVPGKTTPLTDAIRATAGTQYERIATCLEALK